MHLTMGLIPMKFYHIVGIGLLGFAGKSHLLLFWDVPFLLEHIGQKEKKCHFFGVVVGSFILFYLSVPTLASKLLQSRNLVI